MKMELLKDDDSDESKWDKFAIEWVQKYMKITTNFSTSYDAMYRAYYNLAIKWLNLAMKNYQEIVKSKGGEQK